MARHSSGKNNYALSGGVIAALLAAVVLVGIGVTYLATRDFSASSPGTDTAASCVAGDLELPVAASDKEVGQSLVDAYAATDPVVRDFCVRPTLVESLTDAAVYIAPNTPVTHQQLAQQGRTASTSEPDSVYSERVGVAGRAAPSDAAAVDLARVTFPVDEEPSASALVAAALAAGNDQAAVDALTKQRAGTVADAERAGELVATTESNVPQGMTFTAVGPSAVFTAVPLDQGGTVTEEQARAGQDFARSASERFDGDAEEQPAVSDIVWAAATPTGGESITREDEQEAAPADGGPLDTLFLLDTSEAMAPFIDQAASAIGEAAQRVTDSGHQVALWNYSSPLSPGVTQGYRRNVAFTGEAGEVAGAAERFLTGGQPQTREAVSAAVDYTREAAAPARIVVITTGTSDGGDDNAFADAVTSAAGSGVSLSVVHVGGGQQDEALRRVSSSLSQAESPDQLATTVRAAAGLGG